MWSHYANKHKGICIEYENIKDTYPIGYIKKEKFVNFFRFVKIYLASLNDGNSYFNENELVALFPILNKSEDWKEEQEVRTIISSKNKLITKKSTRVGVNVSDKDK